MVEETEKRIISIQIDEAAKNKLLRGLKEVESASKKTALETLKLGDAGRASAAKLTNAQKEQIRLSKESGAQLEKQVRSLLDVKDAADKAADSLSNAGRAGSGGNIGGGVADIRGALGSVSGGAFSGGLEIAGGVGDAIEAFKGAGIAGGIAALAIGAMSLAIGEATKAAEAQAQAINTLIDAQRQVSQQVIGGLTSDEAQARLEELNRLRADEEARLVTLQGAYDEAIDSLGALGFIAQQTAPQEQALADQIQTSSNNVQAYNAEISALNRQLENGNIAANDTALAESELAATREAEAQRAIQAAEQAALQIARLEQQRSDLIANRAIAEANANELEAFDRRIALQDEKKELVDHQNELKSIREAGAKKIEAIDKELSALPNELVSALAEASTKGNAQLSKLNNDYYASQLKANADFNKESERIAQDTGKAVARLSEDIRDNLRDAIRENDVAAFLKAQEDGNKELRRSAEDARTEEQRRVEDFIAAQEEQRQAFQERQREIIAGIDEERARIQQSFIERRAALDAQRQAELAATQQAIANAVARFNQEEALEAQTASRKAQRLALQEGHENAAFQRTLAKIGQEIAGVGTVESAFISSISRISAAANSIAAGSKSASSFYNKPSSTYQSPYQSSGFQKAGAGAGGVTINMTVGDVATGSMVTDAVNAAKGQIYNAVTGAMAGATN